MTLDQDVVKEHETLKLLAAHIIEDGEYSQNGYNEFRYEVDRIKEQYPVLYRIWDSMDYYHLRHLH